MRLPASHDHTATHRRTRRWFLAVAVGLAATATALGADTQRPADATASSGDYVTTTTPSAPSIDVSGFSPVCIGDAPFISYTIVPVGFTPVEQSATLVIRAVDGTEVGTETVDSLSGQFIWPGASVDAAGNATDWPGWRRAADGVSWEPDPTDDLLRDGLTIEVTVTGAPPATATVDYPPDDSDCANPPDTPPPPTPSTTTPSTTSPSTTSPSTTSPSTTSPSTTTPSTTTPSTTTPSTTTPSTTTPCVPSQDDDCDLSTTGGEPSNLVVIGAATLLAGLAAIAATRHRRGRPLPGVG